MKKTGWIAAVAAGALVAAAACKQPLDIGSFSVTGTWKGTTVVHSATDSVRYTFLLNLTQDQRNVTGTGVVRAPTDSVRTTVSGRWDFPAVTLQMTAPGYGGITYGGSFGTSARRDTLRGPLTGSGFDGTTLVLVRQ